MIGPGSSLDVAFAYVSLTAEADHLFFPRSMILTAALVKELDIGVGEEVMITGLFAHHVGNTRNVPIVRVGNLAAYPSEPVQTMAFGTMNAYLIEARSIGGLSGSPVFVHPGTVRILQGQPQFTSESAFYLMGLIHGHYDQKVGEFAGNARIESVNSGIALVVPIEDILNFIDSHKGQNKAAG